MIPRPIQTHEASAKDLVGAPVFLAQKLQFPSVL